MSSETFSFLQIHIDAARNSTDDFNLFHDKKKWNCIRDNPFQGPIVLGFQLECLIEHRIRLFREQQDELRLIDDQGLKFSNYQFTFANVVKPEEEIAIEIKKSQYRSEENPTLGNRVMVKGANGIALIGYKKESRLPLFLPDVDLPDRGGLRQLPDRSYLPDGGFFLKRKYMSTGNAKNFLSGSLAEQSDYFDELEDKVCFPEMFPVALVSCALLEKGLKDRHDFERDPMVYTDHRITVDREGMKNLKSNDVLHILVKQPEIVPAEKGLGKTGVTQYVHDCFGIFKNQDILYRARISLTPLEEILNASAGKSL